MQLFVQEGLRFEKVASAELEEDATQWPRQVLTELFRVLPEISEYEPDVRFIKSNEEQGYALGVIVVTNTTNTALATQNPGTTAQPTALIPIIVRNGRLSPLDMLMSVSGRMYPLTVDRLREVLYRPESFELLTDDWGDSALAHFFQPPGSGSGLAGPSLGGSGLGGGVSYMYGPGLKQASDVGSVLDAIRGTILEPDLQAFTRQLNEEVLPGAVLNPAMVMSLQKLAASPLVTEDTAAQYYAVLDELYPAQVVQMRWDPAVGAYHCKTAHRETGTVHSSYLSRGDFLRFAGEKVAATVDAEGGALAATASGRAVIVSSGTGDQPRILDNCGSYRVFDAVTGRSHTGLGFSYLISAQGDRVPIMLFCNADGARVQDQIVGSPDWSTPSSGRDVPHEPVKGQGCFVIALDSGGPPQATVPVRVLGSISDRQATRYNVVDLTGEEFTIVLQRGTAAILAFPERGELLLPYNAGFVSTEVELPPLASEGPDAENSKVGAAGILDGRIVVSSVVGDQLDGYRVHFRNLPKLAALHGTDITDFETTVFTLSVAGLDADTACAAMRKVAMAGRCELRAVDLGGSPEVDTHKLAETAAALRALRPGLLKEAAALPDTMTVDAVLALDFINSENVRTFIGMIPQLEKALNKICELVFASRLGQTEIPESAAARAARGLNDTIRGLKSLALRQIEELP